MMVVADKELKARSLLDVFSLRWVDGPLGAAGHQGAVNARQGATNAFRNHPEGARLFKTGSQWVGCYVL